MTDAASVKRDSVTAPAARAPPSCARRTATVNRAPISEKPTWRRRSIIHLTDQVMIYASYIAAFRSEPIIHSDRAQPRFPEVLDL